MITHASATNSQSSPAGLAFVAACGAGVLWGTGALVVNVLVEQHGFTPENISFWRFVVGGVVLVAVFGRSISWDKLMPVLVTVLMAGVAMAGYVLLWFLGIEVQYKDAECVQRPLELAQLTFDDLLRSRVMQALFQTAMLHRSAWDRIGPDDEEIPGGYGEDYEWLLRAARRKPLAVVSDPLVRIRWSGGSFFANRWRTIDSALGYLLDRYPEFSRYRAGHARVLGQRAFALAAAGDRGEALRLAAKTFSVNPLERRTPLAVAVAVGAVRADSVVGWLNARGRGM